MKSVRKISKEFENICLVIEEARNRAFAKVNTELVLLYFHVGKIVSEKVAAGNWGEGTVKELAAYIAEKLPEQKGFTYRGLYRMKQFYETYAPASECFLLWQQTQAQKLSPAATQMEKEGKKKQKANVTPLATQSENSNDPYETFVSTVLAQITWANHLEIFSAIKDAGQQLFYLLMSAKERWNKMELRRQIQSASFERTMLSKSKFSAPPAHLPVEFFKDPYIFEFLQLPELHSEQDLEKALVQNLQQFILEIGKGFTYMGRQYRLQVGTKDYFTDLLFYHRDLQCLVLFELKIQEFEPEFLGKLNFYLEALDRNVKRPHEKPSIGVLLCKGKDTEVVKYALSRNLSPAVIADYETKLIDKKLLARKLHQLTELLVKDKED